MKKTVLFLGIIPLILTACGGSSLKSISPTSAAQQGQPPLPLPQIFEGPKGCETAKYPDGWIAHVSNINNVLSCPGGDRVSPTMTIASCRDVDFGNFGTDFSITSPAGDAELVVNTENQQCQNLSEQLRYASDVPGSLGQPRQQTVGGTAASCIDVLPVRGNATAQTGNATQGEICLLPVAQTLYEVVIESTGSTWPRYGATLQAMLMSVSLHPA